MIDEKDLEFNADEDDVIVLQRPSYRARWCAIGAGWYL